MVADTQSMRDLRQWLCWRLEERNGDPTKVPYSPETHEKAKSTDPKTWTGYQQAVRACKEHGYDGIGFVFTPEDDLCGVDLDGCLDPETGEIESWAAEIIEELDSYTEISPSGTGVHILMRATLPEGRNRKGRFEAYDRGRYFTVTGKHLSDTPQSIEGRQEELRGVVGRVCSGKGAETATQSLWRPLSRWITISPMMRSFGRPSPLPTGRGSPGCGPETRADTGAIPRRTWRCAGCWRSGPGEMPRG